MESKKDLFLGPCREGKAALRFTWPHKQNARGFLSWYILFLFCFFFSSYFFPFDLFPIIISADPLQFREKLSFCDSLFLVLA